MPIIFELILYRTTNLSVNWWRALLSAKTDILNEYVWHFSSFNFYRFTDMLLVLFVPILYYISAAKYPDSELAMWFSGIILSAVETRRQRIFSLPRRHTQTLSVTVSNWWIVWYLSFTTPVRRLNLVIATLCEFAKSCKCTICLKKQSEHHHLVMIPSCICHSVSEPTYTYYCSIKKWQKNYFSTLRLLSYLRDPKVDIITIPKVH